MYRCTFQLLTSDFSLQKKRKERSSNLESQSKKARKEVGKEDSTEESADLAAHAHGDSHDDTLPQLEEALNGEDDLDSDVEDTSILTSPPKPRKTKFEIVNKTPKDRRVGSTTFRVAKSHNSNLAPRVNLDAKLTKESWLEGRSSKGVLANRRPMKQSFFKK